MKTRIVKDKRVGEGFTLARRNTYYPADHQRMYCCWFETRQEAIKYLKARKIT